ncbi:hypothetical protein CSUI_003590 [Cystoisospora suis]|uniref:Transmembrane protein n=1 Tax=Cystoisospora suis TaxID=483139 RepID=A0A2C6L4U3_9APIC|nr:hypothetical protein CSUI_003590 [Cystoisospora suis]
MGLPKCFGGRVSLSFLVFLGTLAVVLGPVSSELEDRHLQVDTPSEQRLLQEEDGKDKEEGDDESPGLLEQAREKADDLKEGVKDTMSAAGEKIKDASGTVKDYVPTKSSSLRGSVYHRVLGERGHEDGKEEEASEEGSSGGWFLGGDETSNAEEAEQSPSPLEQAREKAHDLTEGVKSRVGQFVKEQLESAGEKLKDYLRDAHPTAMNAAEVAREAAGV